MLVLSNFLYLNLFRKVVSILKNYFDVKGKNAIVTGASSGLGKQFALCLAEQGANVAIAARRVERLEELKPQIEAYGVKCLVLPCDVTDTAQIRNAAEKTFKEFGSIDILINNAAAGFATPAIECSDETWENTMATNVNGVFYFCREVGKFMVEKGAGLYIDDNDINSKILYEKIEELVKDSAKLKEIQQNSFNLAHLDGTEKIVEQLESILRN